MIVSRHISTSIVVAVADQYPDNAETVKHNAKTTAERPSSVGRNSGSVIVRKVQSGERRAQWLPARVQLSGAAAMPLTMIAKLNNVWASTIGSSPSGSPGN